MTKNLNYLPRVLLGVLFCLIALLAVAIVTSFSSNANALIDVSPSHRATVDAVSGSIVEATFQLRNTSGDNITLLGADSPCGCTTVDAQFPATLSPGDFYELKIKMAVGMFNADGKFSTTTTVLVDKEGTVPPLIVEAISPS